MPTDATEERLPRMLSLAVHELRTPVTVIAGYLRMLLREQAGPLTEKQRKMLEETDRSCGRIGALVAEMSDLGKFESGEVLPAQQEVDLSQLTALLASDLQEGRDRGVQLEVRGADRPITVLGDHARLAAVVKTVLHAALRERGEPGVVIAACTALGDATPPWAVLAVGEEALIPTLIDTARGATPPPFDEWRGGLGLAMPVGRRVVELHGGALWSSPGLQSRSGTALRLPLRA